MFLQGPDLDMLRAFCAGESIGSLGNKTSTPKLKASTSPVDSPIVALILQHVVYMLYRIAVGK